MNRVKTVGVDQAAREAGTWPKLVQRWVDDMDKMIAADEHDMELIETAQEKTQESTHEMAEEKGTEDMKKGSDFTPEERDAIVARAQKVGAKKAAEEAGTDQHIVAAWMAGLKKRSAVKPDKGVIPGQNGLPAKRDNLSDYTGEERRLLVAKSNEVGYVVVQKAYGLRHNTLFDWRRTILRQDKRAEENRVETKQLEIQIPAVTATTVNNNAIVPGQNGLPAKRDDPHDYTKEERRLLVAKADEVGNPAVKAAYGFNNNYTIHDWRRSLMRQAKKAEKQIVGIEAKESEIKLLKTANENTMHTEKTAEPERTAEQTVVMSEVLPQEAAISQNIPLGQQSSTATSPSTSPSTTNYPAANYPPEVEVIMLREKVAALNSQIENLREMLQALVKLV